MGALRNITEQTLHDLLANKNFSAGGLAINAAGATGFKSASAYQYTIDGIFKSKPALAAQAFSTHPPQAVGITQYYVVGLDVNGNVFTFQGGEETFIQLGISTTVPVMPDVPPGICPIGAIKVVTNTIPFVANTTPLDSAGMAITYVDLSVLPTVPF
jgi:hypothetical protein